VVQSTELDASWERLRTLIADCPDLPNSVRQRLIAQGDAAGEGAEML